MERLGELWRRFVFLFRRNQLRREMEEEMSFHLASKAEQNLKSGMGGDEAVHAARRRFGNATLFLEKSCDAWNWGALNRFIQDIKIALRVLSKNPVFASVIILTLAFGIGVNTAIFTAVNALLLNPYPFPAPDRIVSVEAQHISGKNSSTGYRDFLDWKQQNTVFDAMAITPWIGGYTLTGMGEPEHITGGATTADFLRVLEIEPVLGRFFTDKEDESGAQRVAVLTYPTWKQRFGGDSNILGRALMLNGQPYTIIGVLPRSFAFPGIETCEFFTPLREHPWQGRNQHQYGVVARLKDGITITPAQSDMTTIARRLEQQFPATNTGWGVAVMPLQTALSRETKKPMMVLFAAVGFVLLLACVNVAGLLLARISSRAREIAIRSSLGAGRGRIVCQMLTETVLLSLCGGVVGIFLASCLMRVLRTAAPQNFALDTTLHLNPEALIFTLGVSLLTGLAAGFVPAWSIAGTDPNTALKDDGSTWIKVRSRNRLMTYLVAGEVGLSLILLAGAGLLVKSFVSALRMDIGLRTENVLTFALNLPNAQYSSKQLRSAFYQDLLAKLQASPGVEAAAGVATLPMGEGMAGGAFQVEGRPKVADWIDTLVQYDISTPGYFKTMGIPILRGRDFEERDSATSQPVGIVNEMLVKQFFPNEDPIGRRYRDDYDGKWRTIIGVVGSVHHQQPANAPVAGVYSPHAQSPIQSMWIMVRSRTDAASLTSTVRSVVRNLDRNLPLLKVRTMRQVVSDSLSEPRLLMAFLTGFAFFALLLTAIGVYGIVEYSVDQRTHEMGIRVALGASYRDLIGLVLRGGALPTFAGVAVGLPITFLVTGLMRALLSGLNPYDVTVYLGASLLLILVALLAGFLPARRAATVDTMAALRHG